MPGDEKYTFSYLAPLPSYDEAILSRPSSSNSHLGPNEVSDDAERQGLLNDDDLNDQSRSRSNYAAPTVESERSSIDSVDGLGADDEAETVRREMQEMDVEDPLAGDNDASRSLLGSRFKRFTSFTSVLPTLNLRRFLPSWKLRFPQLPKVDWQSLDANRAVILGRLVGIFIIGILVYVLFASDVIGLSGRRNIFMFKPESIRAFLLDGFMQSDHMPEYLRRITLSPHLAGTKGDYELGAWIEEEFKAGGLIGVNMERFDVMMNFPRKDGRAISIVEGEDNKIIWTANVEEEEEEDYVFFGGSISADVTGNLIYVNQGSDLDYEDLEKIGVSVDGAIVLARYFPQNRERGLVVKRAELKGARGCIMYADQSKASNRRLPDDGVQRGSVSLWSWVLGDVLSPGWASTPAANERLQPDESKATPKIPSFPISWNSAEHLLNALSNHGESLHGNMTGDPRVSEYWTGSSGSDAVRVNLKNLQDVERKQPIYNVLGKIDGLEQRSKRIIVGNHRDAWCTGASEPGSGTAVMLEVIRQFGELQSQGWGPLRTIEFVSWDASEFNLIGSTEHVESRLEELKNDAIAYINIGAAISGDNFRANGSPLFEKALRNTLGRVGYPGTGETILKQWEEAGQSLEPLRGRGDFIPFQSIAGVPSIDIRFEGDNVAYGSCYDNFEYLQRAEFVWERHKAMAAVLALLIVELSDHALIPLDLDAYSNSLSSYIDKLDKTVNAENTTPRINLQPLRAAQNTLSQTSNVFTEFDNEWHSKVYATGGFESSYIGLKRIERNEKIEHFDKLFLNNDGLPDRPQFKHVIFGPQKWYPYEDALFPGIMDQLEDVDKAQDEVQRVADIISEAAAQMA